jgi:hypothetical protein
MYPMPTSATPTATARPIHEGIANALRVTATAMAATAVSLARRGIPSPLR